MDDQHCSYLKSVLEEIAGSLVELRAPSNTLSTSCIAMLAAAISVQMPALKTLDLADNALGDDDILPLLSAMSVKGNLPALDLFNLGLNQLTSSSMLKALDAYDRANHGALEIDLTQNCVGFDSNALGDASACVYNQDDGVCYQGAGADYVCCYDSRAQDAACADNTLCTMTVQAQTSTDQAEKSCIGTDLVGGPNGPTVVKVFKCLSLIFTQASCTV